MTSGSKPNFLDYVPSKKLESTTDEGGKQVLLLPKFGDGRIGRWWSSLIGQQRAVLKIHLDDMGTRTWHEIDGHRSIAEIADAVQSLSDQPIESHYELCSRFIKMLINAGAVNLDPPGST